MNPGKLFRHFCWKQLGLKEYLRTKSKSDLQLIKERYLTITDGRDLADYFVAAHISFIIDKILIEQSAYE